MKKLILIITIILIVIIACVCGFFIIKSLNTPTDIIVTLNDKILDIDKIDDILTYNEDTTISWNNTNYKVKCNGVNILPGSVINQNGNYEFEFSLKDISKKFNINMNKNLTFKIVDYDGNEIHNYSTNYKPFKIITDDDIKVNNKDVDFSNGFYETGDYKLTSSNFDSCIIELNGIELINEYSYYITYNTLPTLYATLNLTNIETPTYFWYGSSINMNKDEIIKNTNIKVSDFSGNSDLFISNVLSEVKENIKEIFNTDKNAYFHLYTDDTNHWLEYPLFAELGLENSRYDITYYSSGDKSYSIDELYSYINDEDYKSFLQVQEDEIKLLTEVRSNKYMDTRDYILGILPNKVEYLNDYILPSTFKSNITYLLEYPELFNFKDEKLNTALLNNKNITKYTLAEGYDRLKATQKELFLQYIGFNKTDFDNNYLNMNYGKGYLIILADDLSNYTSKEIKNMLSQIVEKYSEKYNILFKSSENYTKILNELDITAIDDSIPMEIITLIYPDLKFGGNSKSLYMTLNSQNTLFFFAEDKTELVAPLNVLSDELYKDIEFISPKASDKINTDEE